MEKRKLNALSRNLKEESAVLTSLRKTLGEDAPETITDAMNEMATRAKDIATFIQNLAAGAIPIKVAIVGDFNAGKSSFINSLLGDKLCPERADPTTSYVTTFTYGAEEKITRHHLKQKATLLSREQYTHQVQAGTAKSKGSAPLRFTFQLPHTLLRGIELLDTPGFNNPRNKNDSKITADVMKDADAFIYILDAVVGAIASSGLESIKRIPKEARAFLLINKADTKSAEGLAKIKTDIKKQHGAFFEEEVWTYSSKEVRSDINSRREIERILIDVKNDNWLILTGKIQLLLRSHFDSRLTIGSKLAAALQEWVEDFEEGIQRRRGRWEAVRGLLLEIADKEEDHFRQELAECLPHHITPKEIPSSGYFWNDAEIVYRSRPFRNAMRTFASLQIIENGVTGAIARLFADTGKLKSKVFQEVAEKSAERADQFIRKNLGSQETLRFSSYDNAMEALNSAIPEYLSELCDAAWMPWSEFLSNVLTEFEADFCHVHKADIQHRAARIRKGLDEWEAICEHGRKRIDPEII